MLSKIKTVLSVIGAVLSVILFTIVLFLLRRNKADGRGSTANTERNSRIKEGLEESSGEIAECRSTVERCEEHLQRAEDILRNAIKRSREETGEPENSSNSN